MSLSLSFSFFRNEKDRTAHTPSPLAPKTASDHQDLRETTAWWRNKECERDRERWRGFGPTAADGGIKILIAFWHYLVAGGLVSPCFTLKATQTKTHFILPLPENSMDSNMWNATKDCNEINMLDWISNIACKNKTNVHTSLQGKKLQIIVLRENCSYYRNLLKWHILGNIFWLL